MKKIKLIRLHEHRGSYCCDYCDAIEICKTQQHFVKYLFFELDLNKKEQEQLEKDRISCGSNKFIFKVPFFRAKNKRRF